MSRWNASVTRIIPPYIPGGGGGGGSSDHSELINLIWNASGHVGNPDTFAVFDGSGNATYLATSLFALVSDLGITAFSNSYLDLDDLPSGFTLSDDPALALGVAAPGTSLEASRADHVHPMPSASDVGADAAGTAASAISAFSLTLASVAFSGNYSDLSGTPTVPDVLNDLSNVSGAPNTNDVLTFTGSSWEPVAPSSGGATELNDLTDVDTGSQSNNDVLAWNSSDSEWQSLTLGNSAYSNDYNDLDNLPTIPEELNDLNNVSGTPSSGHVLTFTGSGWEPASVPSAPTNISDLNDVDTAGVTNQDALIYNSGDSEWQAVSLANIAFTGDYGDLTGTPSIPDELNDLSNVDTGTPLDNDVLIWNQGDSEWQSTALGDTAYSNDYEDLDNLPSLVEELNDLNDVDTAGVIDADVLSYDSGSSEWVPLTLADVATSGSYGDLTGTPTVPEELNDLNDVSGTPSAGYVLTFTGSGWEPEPVPSAPVNISDLSDVDTAGVTDQDALIYNSGDSEWQATTLSDIAFTGDYGDLTGVPTFPDASDDNPEDLGIVDPGVSNDYSRSDHVHAMPDLDDLSNVNTTGIIDRNILIWNNTASEWELESLSDVAFSNDYEDLDNLPSIPDVLEDLSNVDTSGVTNEDVLSYDSGSSEWVPLTLADIATSGSYSDLIGAPSIPDELNDLSDVSGTPSAGHVLTFTGSGWEPEPVPSAPTNISDLNDVDTAGVVDQDVLVYNNTASEWQPLALGDTAYSNDYEDLDNLPSIPNLINDLTDVDTSGVSNQDVLSYNLSGTEWVPLTLADVALSGDYTDLINTPTIIDDHDLLNNLEWIASGHTAGTGDTLAAFDTTGDAELLTIGQNLEIVTSVLKTTGYFEFTPRATAPSVSNVLWVHDGSNLTDGTLEWDDDFVINGSIDVGGIGQEQSSIRIDSSIVPTRIRSSALGGTPILLLLHQHSNVEAASLVFSRSNGNGTSHTIVTNGTVLGDITKVGWSGTGSVGYLPATRIQSVIEGTVSSTAMPGRLEFLTTPAASTSPTLAVYISAQQVLGLEYALEFADGTSVAVAPANKVRLRQVGGELQYSYDGGAYVPLSTVGELNDLTDVDTAGVTDGDVLSYDSGSSEWIPLVLADVATSGSYSDLIGTPSIPDELNDLSDVSGTPSIGHVLTYTATGWEPEPIPSAPVNISDLSDVDTAGVTDQDALIYNSGDSEWQAVSLADVAFSGDYGDLSNTPSIPDASNATPQALGIAAAGSSDDYSRADHVHAMPAIEDLTNVDTTGAVNNSILVYDLTETEWIIEDLADVAFSGDYTDLINTPTIPDASNATPEDLGTADAGISADYSRADHVHNMPDLGDIGTVDLSGLATNDLLSYDGSNWVPVSSPSVPTALSDLTDVDTAGATLDDILVYDGSEWIAQAPPSGLGDVVGPSSSKDDAYAVFDGTTGKLIKDSDAGYFAGVNSGRDYTGIRAIGSPANVALVVSPKGNGGVLAHIPDNATTGGNNRGNFAVDFQQTRSNADRVASGFASVICGGQSNQANFSGAFAGGGINNRVNGIDAVICGGNNNLASGFRGVILGGRSNIASGAHSSTLGGEECWATADYTVAIGRQALADHYGEIAYSSRALGPHSSAQRSDLMLQRQTSDNTPTELTLDNLTPGANNRLDIKSNNTTYKVELEILATQIIGGSAGSPGDSRWWSIKTGIKRWTSTSFFGSTIIETDGDTATEDWEINLSINASAHALVIEVVGEDNKPIRWVCHAKLVKSRQ